MDCQWNSVLEINIKTTPLAFLITCSASNGTTWFCFRSLNFDEHHVSWARGEQRSIVCGNSFVLHFILLQCFAYQRVWCQFIHVTYDYSFVYEQIIDPRREEKCLFIYGSRIAQNNFFFNFSREEVIREFHEHHFAVHTPSSSNHSVFVSR